MIIPPRWVASGPFGTSRTEELEVDEAAGLCAPSALSQCDAEAEVSRVASPRVDLKGIAHKVSSIERTLFRIVSLVAGRELCEVFARGAKCRRLVGGRSPPPDGWPEVAAGFTPTSRGTVPPVELEHGDPPSHPVPLAARREVRPVTQSSFCGVFEGRSSSDCDCKVEES
jgi:hypothetical protein